MPEVWLAGAQLPVQQAVWRRSAGAPRIVGKMRLEKAGRGGKSVTVVYDLPRNEAFLKELCSDLKRACGTGGAVRDDTVEIQGDLRERVRDVFRQKGYAIKGG